MRFAFAFIPTLLSVFTVLAQGIYPYAGYRVHAPSAVWFSFATAVFEVPEVWWNCHQGLGQRAFIMVGIGDPLTCEAGAGIEAGISILCTTIGMSYRAYWKLSPHDVREVDLWPADLITRGDEIFVTLRTDHGHIIVHIENRSRRLTSGDLEVGTTPEIRGCLGTVVWGLRADTDLTPSGGIHLWPPPGFDEIYFHTVRAQDFFHTWYRVEGAEELKIRDSVDFIWAWPYGSIDLMDENAFIIYP